ncbi:MAG: 2-amino-4-hydroxy-6-hydroxymethyldihydropteridine diphosphokinase [Erythrobacter sp.]
MDEASRHSYLIALGSNMRVSGIGNPRAVVARALHAMSDLGLDVIASSRVVETDPLGPSLRRYANAAAIVEADLAPPELLRFLQAIELAFGRKRRGQPWRARPLDLDIILWSGGIWVSPGLAVPHPRFRERAFVLDPAKEVAAGWRDPASGFTLRQLAARAA